MKYLVLRPFTTFGKYVIKGTILDESEIRSPRLRQSEGKIIPIPVEIQTDAVSSSESSGEGKATGAPVEPLQDIKKDAINGAEPKKLFSFSLK